MVLGENISVNGQIEETTNYKYFGRKIYISRDKQTHKLFRRICLACAVFGNLKHILKLTPLFLAEKDFPLDVLPIVIYENGNAYT